MELKAKIDKIDNTYKAPIKQLMRIKVLNTSERNAVIRIYEGEISAANYITEMNVPARKDLLFHNSFTGKDVSFEIDNDGIKIALFHD